MSEASGKEISEAGAEKSGAPRELELLHWGAVAISVALGCLSSWTLFFRSPFVRDNQLPLSTRTTMLGVTVIIAAAVPFALSSRGPSSERPEAARRWANVLAPLGLLALVPHFFDRQSWLNRELAFLAALLGFGLLATSLVSRALREEPLRAFGAAVEARFGKLAKRLAWLVVGGLVLFYVFRVGTLTTISHSKLQTMSSDLAEFDNLFFNALHGHPFRAPAIEGDLRDFSALKVHAEFGLYFLLPFYALRPSAVTLLWIQAALVALTAIPVFLTARSRLGAAAGAVFALVYLCMPAVERPNFYDFHFTPLGMLFVAWFCYFLERAAKLPSSVVTRRLLWASFVLALISREDVSLGLIVLGVFVHFSGRLPKVGAIVAAVSLGYFVIVKFFIMPRFGLMWFDMIYEDLKAPGARGFGAVALTLLTNPGFVVRSLLTEAKLLYVLHMVVPVGALFLYRRSLWSAFLPGFVSTLLVTNRPPMSESSFQYTYLWVPYVIVAAMLGLEHLRERFGRERFVAALSVLGFSAFALDHQMGVLFGGESIRGGFLDKTFVMSEAETRRLASLERLIRRIPENASVTASEMEGPHVSSRLVMYSLKFTLGKAPDYILIGHVGIGGEARHLGQALASRQYGLVEQDGPYYLLKRGADPSRNGPLRRYEPKPSGQARMQ